MTQTATTPEITVTPDLVATVATDKGFAWLVTCEGVGCSNQVLSPKRSEFPVCGAYPQGQITHFTAPGARRCAACGPF